MIKIKIVMMVSNYILHTNRSQTWMKATQWFLTHWLIPSFIILLIHSDTHLLTDSLIISLTDWLIHFLPDALPDSFTHSLTNWLIYSLLSPRSEQHHRHKMTLQAGAMRYRKASLAPWWYLTLKVCVCVCVLYWLLHSVTKTSQPTR